MFPCGHESSPENTRANGRGCKRCHRERERVRRSQNPERIREINRRAGRKRNGPERNAYQRAWYAANRDKMRAYYRRNTHLRKHAKGDVDTVYYIDLLAGDPCVYCGDPAETVEHIIPTARGGESHWTNYAAACVDCNKSKHAASLLRFLLRSAG